MVDRLRIVCHLDRMMFHPPTFKHSDWKSASDEAQRLARENPGQTFHVLASVECFKKADVQSVAFEGADWLKEVCNGVPF